MLQSKKICTNKNGEFLSILNNTVDEIQSLRFDLEVKIYDEVDVNKLHIIEEVNGLRAELISILKLLQMFIGKFGDQSDGIINNQVIKIEQYLKESDKYLERYIGYKKLFDTTGSKINVILENRGDLIPKYKIFYADKIFQLLENNIH